MIPWCVPVKPAHLDREAPQQPHVRDDQDGPGDLGHRLAGFFELEALHHEGDHEHRGETKKRPRQHVKRPRRVVAQGRDVRRADRCGTPTCGSQLATSSASTPPITEFPDGRALVASRSPTSSRAAATNAKPAQQEPERIPGSQPFVDDEREQEPGYHRQADKNSGRKHVRRARPGLKGGSIDETGPTSLIGAHEIN